ncbi:MAG: class A beta-lactamase [Acidobacteriota bacterium]
MRVFVALSFLFVAVLVGSASAPAQLSQKIAQIAAQAQGPVGVACSLPGTKLDCDLDADRPLPMQSVYKLPTAMAALHAVEQGKLRLDQKLRFLPTDIQAPDEYSPLKDAHPHGNVDVPLEDLLRAMITQSDNVANDIVMRALGGPSVSQAYMRSLGIQDIQIRDNEKSLNNDERLQEHNTATPQALVTLLRRLADCSPLSAEHTRLLLGWMTTAQTGNARIKALLPAGTQVADKTGTAGMNRTFTNATNDAALITLPNGRRLALVVLVADVKAPFATRERVIAQIAKAVYEAAGQATQP